MAVRKFFRFRRFTHRTLFGTTTLKRRAFAGGGRTALFAPFRRFTNLVRKAKRSTGFERFLPRQIAQRGFIPEAGGFIKPLVPNSLKRYFRNLSPFRQTQKSISRTLRSLNPLRPPKLSFSGASIIKTLTSNTRRTQRSIRPRNTRPPNPAAAAAKTARTLARALRNVSVSFNVQGANAKLLAKTLTIAGNTKFSPASRNAALAAVAKFGTKSVQSTLSRLHGVSLTHKARNQVVRTLRNKGGTAASNALKSALAQQQKTAQSRKISARRASLAAQKKRSAVKAPRPPRTPKPSTPKKTTKKPTVSRKKTAVPKPKLSQAEITRRQLLGKLRKGTIKSAPSLGIGRRRK